MSKVSKQREFESKSVDFDSLEFKDEDGAHPGGTLQGYAAVFNNVDLQNEVIAPGAFKKTIESTRGKVVVLDSHSVFGGVANAIGRTISLEERPKGLFFRAYFATTERAQEVRKLIKEGVINRMSIGFNVIVDEFDRLTRVRRLKEIKLLEVSPVIFPANPATSVSAKYDAGDQVDHSKLMSDFRQGLRTVNDYLVDERLKQLGARSTRNARPPSPETLAKFRAALRTMREFSDAVETESPEDQAQAFNRRVQEAQRRAKGF